MDVSGTFNLAASATWSQSQTRRVTLDCDTVAGVVTINLPPLQEVADRGGNSVEVVINDAGNNADNNNITINADGTDRIEGAASLVVSTATETVVLVVANEANWATL
jgi:hypothetical protein